MTRRPTHLPGDVELVVAHEIRVVAFEGVQDERLVGLRDVNIRETALVGEVHLRRNRTRVEAGGLGVELEIHGLGRLDTEDELVAGDVLEDALRDVLELNADLNLGLVQRWRI